MIQSSVIRYVHCIGFQEQDNDKEQEHMGWYTHISIESLVWEAVANRSEQEEITNCFEKKISALIQQHCRAIMYIWVSDLK